MNSKTLYDAVWGGLVRSVTVIHSGAHRASGGRLWNTLPGGGRLIFLTTLGRRTGEWRTNPLLAVRVDEQWIVTGSNGGRARLPGWVFNARADSRCVVTIGGERWPGRIEEVTDAERDRLYAILSRAWRLYPMYERRAGRYIPVFRISTGRDEGQE